MLDWQTILWCHTRVPVFCWPVLWYWLGRLADTYIVYEQEGRRFFRWHLEPDGRIWVEYCDESDAERARRGGLPPGFSRAPWARHETHIEPWRPARPDSAPAPSVSTHFPVRVREAAAGSVHAGNIARHPP